MRTDASPNAGTGQAPPDLVGRRSWSPLVHQDRKFEIGRLQMLQATRAESDFFLAQLTLCMVGKFYREGAFDVEYVLFTRCLHSPRELKPWSSGT